MSSEKRASGRNGNQRNLKVAFATLGLVGFAFLSNAPIENAYFKQARSFDQRKSWPTTVGEVGQVETPFLPRGKASTPCFVRVHFTYTVDGKQFTASQSEFLDREFASIGDDQGEWKTIYTDSSYCDKVAADIKANRTQTVYYDRSDPQNAFIDIDYSVLSNKIWWYRFVVIGAGIVFFFFFRDVYPAFSPR